jgi:two-component system chemotaxis response regulator CheY
MLNVLIVDDNFFMRSALRQQLKILGCQVVGEAATVEQGMELFRALRPDLITVDVVLDPDSGLSLAEKICKEDPKAKVLMVSAVGQRQIMDDARRVGASGYVSKPVEMDALKEAIQKITGGTL